MAIEIVRAVFIEGARVEPGTVIELDRRVERELCNTGRARPATQAPAASAPEAPKRAPKKDSP
jgi:hypothetical protein